MKGITRFILIVLAAGLIYYFNFSGSKSPNQVAPSQPRQQTQAPPSKPVAPPAQVYPESVADHLLPMWPPARSGNDTVQLADSLTRKNFVLILDGSGSMIKPGCSGDRAKSEVAKEAVIEWSSSVPEDANLGLIVFDNAGFSIRLPLGRQNREQFIAEVDKVVPNYKTPLTESLNTAYTMLTEQARSQLGYGEYTVVIVTDGIANDINALAQSVNMVLSTSPIMIHTIGFCIEEDHSLNRKGRTIYRAANNPAELRSGLQEVLAESATFDISGFK